MNPMLKMKDEKLKIIKNVFLFGVIIILLWMYCYYIHASYSSNECTSEEISVVNVLEPIIEGSKIEQRFICETYHLESLKIMFGTYQKVNQANLFVELLNENNNLIYKWEVNEAVIADNEYYVFELDNPIENTKNKVFNIRVYSDAKDYDNAISVYYGNAVEGCLLKVDGEGLEQTICFQTVSSESKPLVFNIFVCVIPIILIIVGIVLYKVKLTYEKQFMVVYVVLGLVFHIAIPAFAVPDEHAHYCRAYEVSQGHMTSEINEEGYGGREFPANLLFAGRSDYEKHSDLFQYRDEQLSKEKTFHIFTNISLYAPTGYLPQAIGIKLMSCFTDNCMMIFYAGRIVNWITALIITYFALKYLPFGKKIVSVILLLPMNLQEVVSYSSDAMVTVCVFAMVSFILHMKYVHQGEFEKKHYIIMYTLAIFLSLYKVVYVPFCLLLFLLPIDKFKNKKTYTKHVFILGTSVIVASLGWLLVANKYLIEYNQGVDSAKQVGYILTHIPQYIYIMFATVVDSVQGWLYTMTGAALGWFNVPVNSTLIEIYFLLLICAVISASKEKISIIQRVDRRLLLVCSSLTFLLICTSLYVQWTPVGNIRIIGIQGRYFLPILLPVLLVISNCINVKVSPQKEVKHNNFLMLLLALGLCVGYAVLYFNF